jgi:hypothetical protein
LILTSFIKKYFGEKSTVFSAEDYKFIDKISFKNDEDSIYDYINNPEWTTLFFKKGLVVFYIDFNRHTKEKTCYMIYYYKDKKSTKFSADKLLKEFIKFLKLNGCIKMIMCTELDPKLWIKNYGFKITRYEMELKL